MDEISDLLGCILGVVGLVQQFPILPGFAGGDFVHVYPLVAELCQELRREHNSCDVPSGNQVDFTPMSQLPKPKVVCLLIQQGCHWQFQRITSLNVQFLCEGRLTNATRKSQAIDFLIVVMVFVLLPMRIGIKAIGAAVISRCVTSR